MATPSEEIDVNLFDMVLCLARAIDFLHPTISEHHLRTAYIASCLAEELSLDSETIQEVLIAGALHDLAAACSPAWSGLLDAALTHDLCNHLKVPGELHRHGFEGYLMLRDFPPFARAAHAIRFHHVNWDDGRGAEFEGMPTPLSSHILRLADHVATLPNDAENILAQAGALSVAVAAGSPRLFHPEVAQAFVRIASSEAFWLDVTNRHKEMILKRRFGIASVALNLEGLHRLSEVFGKIIDYRSAFTAMHSSGVAATSEQLAARLGLPAAQQRLIGVAGYLHDIGKLAVPPELLGKPGKLTPHEMFIIKQHPYFTYQILAMVPGLETVNTWASLHHERLDGTGYPFRTRDIPLGSRIVAVADVFTAITEDRPYRSGMSQAQCLAVLDKLALEQAIDGDIVATLRSSFEDIHHVRRASQQAAIA
jgi:HD-GYP domain-containing protein (c-di-GMP phosphodiesterase class II)